MSQAESQAATPSKWVVWSGRVLSVLPVAVFTFSGAMKLVTPAPKDMVEGMAKLGWPIEYARGLGILELACTVIYAIPQTAVLGAILLTGYLGGAIATHVRTGDFGIAGHVVFGILIWLGVFLRDPRLRALAPWRRLSK